MNNINPAVMSVIGICIVFGTLILMALFVSVIRWADDRWEEREHQEKKDAFTKAQTVDDTTLVLISAAIATYFKGRAHIKRIRVLPSSPKRGGAWATEVRNTLQSSHVTKK